VRYEAVVFDLYGTLIDVFSRREYEQVLREMSASLRVPHEPFARAWLVDTVEARGTGAFSSVEACIEQICRQMNVRVTSDGIRRAAALRMAFVKKSLEPRADACATLVALEEAGMKRGLVSNCSLELPRLWPATPLADQIEATILSSAVGIRKPDPAIYRLACERLDVRPARCLYVGDGDDHELTGAAAVGMHPVLIRAPHEDASEALRSHDTSAAWQGDRVSSLTEVLAVAGCDPES